MKISPLVKAILVIFFVLLIDQLLKIYIKTNYYLGEEIPVLGDWFKLHFTENPGMAFGMKLGGSIGKLFLSIFRILAVIGIGWYLVYLTKRKTPVGLIISIALIFAGAIGNIIDSAFYGLIFDQGMVFSPEINRWIPYPGVAEMNFEGYAPAFKGCVVDMLYFEMYWPEWMPWIGGGQVFPPVFNIADSSITVGVFLLLIFQGRFFKKTATKEPVEPQKEDAAAVQ
ncbi:MAG: lipoprotein signal peptidase [Bacteroidetes bacterium GWF2_38_335]|nr:MAG: lipoprotein signal peptidase [Bacteroidetes bacterium GWF2_38_335]OFY79359.1 MAG: lipoprotein signal peptidase [Bacteroidetes bacterium RIFOXYA12_FULL_38_20]HBS85619.1 lipoprotein signal peptidase [Bacteroidales bacterium]